MKGIVDQWVIWREDLGGLFYGRYEVFLYRHEIQNVQRQSKSQLAGETFLTKKRLQEPSQAKRREHPLSCFSIHAAFTPILVFCLMVVFLLFVPSSQHSFGVFYETRYNYMDLKWSIGISVPKFVTLLKRMKGLNYGDRWNPRKSNLIVSS